MGAGHTTPDLGVFHLIPQELKTPEFWNLPNNECHGMLLSKKYHTGVSMIFCVCLKIYFYSSISKIYIYISDFLYTI